ncbi:F0F1 ATP synthase subunit epsilon [Gimesia chilikensis]|uniref:F0F1 ATP synthase subunit epsilon n=1 Tax=Gimesia chilikensis TaxID=2605989 RepID=A0A517WG26_9PLAN|nr:F0F1 ATP synthase subunit epsilon [Gimesia chilikensis]QDU04206.1 F0F1 ATP synthase subunit epsilon [Gimesia chilikensis]
MNLKVLLPTEILVHQSVTKVIAEAENGSFCLLPRHVDFLSALLPGILTFVDDQNLEHYLGIGGGILTKTGSEVRVSTIYAVQGEDLGTLRQQVTEQFESINERERTVRSAIARLEADILRHFVKQGITADV